MDSTLKLFSDTLQKICQKDLAAALDLIVPYATRHPYVLYTEDITRADENFRLMMHYMEQGAADPMRRKMYLDMLGKVKAAVRNMRADYRRRNVDFYRDAQSHVAEKMPQSEKGIRIMLEDFVSSVALLQLEPEAERAQKTNEIYTRHYTFMQSLFCSIVVSDMWTEEQARRMKETLLSPTVDSADVQMITSALMLAAMNNFDIHKFNLLVALYSESGDEAVRQKALIGWVLAMTGCIDTEEQRESVERVCRSPKTVGELADLQRQMVFCMNAEKDNATIQRDIMPTLIKNSNLSVTRLGITEKDEDPMQDILDPGAHDRAMEETEEKFQKMMNMQKQGADIFFSGFSQMKRFPFFYNLANWFTPFNVNHPDLAKHTEKLRGTNFLESLLAGGPFCDNDKYSFAIAMANVVDHLPDNVKEMLGNGELLGRGASPEGIDRSAYLRRTALQDLYRFFRLYRWNAQIYNPFTEENCVFTANSLFDTTPLRAETARIGNFLLKKGTSKMMKHLMPALEKADSTESYIVRGVYWLDRRADYDMAMQCFGKVLEREPDNRPALAGYAKAAFRSGNAEEATKAYARLYETEPDRKSLALDYAIALTKTQDYDGAAKILYRLDFQYPESPNVKRVLAWTQMGQGKIQQAEKTYGWLLGRNTSGAMDHLNAGYCNWFAGRLAEAARQFAEFCKMQRSESEAASTVAWTRNAVADAMEREFQGDSAMLAIHGIDQVDAALMKTMVYDKIKQ